MALRCGRKKSIDGVNASQTRWGGGKKKKKKKKKGPSGNSAGLVLPTTLLALSARRAAYSITGPPAVGRVRALTVSGDMRMKLAANRN